MSKINIGKVLNIFLTSLVLTLVLSGATPALAADPVNLWTAGNFAVLAGSTITNTGSSVINGDLGLSPGTSVTGFPPGTLNGAQNVADAVAVQAQTDLITAYDDAAGRTPVSTVPKELGGTTKIPGVYNSVDGTFGITGTLTLDAQGDSSAVFIFKSASTVTAGTGSKVDLKNGAQACNVFWQVTSSATLGTNSDFKGNILSLVSITLNTGANLNGRALARNGAVTMDTNTITAPTCQNPTPSPSPSPDVSPSPSPDVSPSPSPNPGPIPPPPVPELPTLVLISSGIFGLLLMLRIRKD